MFEENPIKVFECSDIDVKKLYNDCLYLEKKILERNKNKEYGYISVTGSETSKHYMNYNLFDYNFSQYEQCLSSIQKCLKKFNPEKKVYFLNAWVNIFRKDEYIHWHAHETSERKGDYYHGFICVNVENTNTHYKFVDGTKQTVQGKDGHIVMGLNDDNMHKSDPWYDSENPRITIAFDICPYDPDVGIHKNYFTITV